MNILNEQLYFFWWNGILSATGQLIICVVSICVLSFFLRKKSARLRYGLWLLVLVNALWTPFITVSIAIANKMERGRPARLWEDGNRLHSIPPLRDSGENSEVNKTYTAPDAGGAPTLQVAGDTPADPGMPSFQGVGYETPEEGIAATKRFMLGLQTEIESLQSKLQQPAIPAHVPKMFAVWIAGSSILGSLLIIRYIIGLIGFSGARTVKSGPIYELYKKCATDLKIRRLPNLLLSDSAKVPFLCGLWKPKVVIPATLPEEITVGELRNVLLHELTHHTRKDMLAVWIEHFVQTLYWYHPAIWFALHKLRHHRESACDETVLASGQTAAGDYGKSLLNTLWAVRGRTADSLGFLGIFERNTFIQNRLEEIMLQQNKVKKVGWFGTALIVLVAACFVPILSAQDPAMEKSPDEIAKRKAEIKEQIASLQKQLDELGGEEPQRLVEAFTVADAEARHAIGDVLIKQIPNLAVSVSLDGDSLTVFGTREELEEASKLMLDYIDKRTNDPEREIHVFKLRNIKAEDAAKAEALKLLPDIAVAHEHQTNSIIIKGTRKEIDLVKDVITKLDNISVDETKFAQITSFLDQLAIDWKIDPDTQNLIISSYPENIDAFIDNISKARNALKPGAVPVPGQNSLKVYQLKYATPNIVIPVLQSIIEPGKANTEGEDCKMTTDNNNKRIILFAPEKIHEIVKDAIEKLDTAPAPNHYPSYTLPSIPAPAMKPESVEKIEEALAGKLENAKKAYEYASKAYEIGAKEGTAATTHQMELAMHQAEENLMKWKYDHAKTEDDRKALHDKISQVIRSEYDTAKKMVDSVQTSWQAGQTKLPERLAAEDALNDIIIKIAKWEE